MRSRLLQYLRPLAKEGVALAFSGGVDSTVVLAALAELQRECGFPLLVVTMSHELISSADIATAREIACSLGVEMCEMPLSVLHLDDVRTNSRARCYACKSHFFSHLRHLAAARCIPHLLDGTNADDLGATRPGLRVLSEQKVCSPLAELGITKAQVRELAAEYALPNAQRPSAPCLATRFNYGTPLSPGLLKQVEEGERALRVLLPAGNLRLRSDTPGGARLEVDAEAMPRVLQLAPDILASLRQLGFRHISLDLAGFRSGSFDSPQTTTTIQ